MNSLSLLASILFTGILLTSCKQYKPEGQGITGTVTWLEGNHMPMMTEDRKANTKAGPKPIQRNVRIYPLTKFSDLKMEEGLFTAIAKKPVAEVESNESGVYSIKLSPGRYSVFIVEEEGLFANIFDGEGNVNPVTVKENEWTLLDVVVNYKAVF
ncbi:carboxypeptidase regulatory-like domain-containing protein [Algoriphagus sp.]|uniref:carboxypeptidase regulatory-like domain-containing protein n=1 Tax=Algoriphagus sp. TaxID=1872435 RepID=UPI00391DCD3D